MQPHQIWAMLRAKRHPLLRPPQALLVLRKSSRPLQSGPLLSESMHRSYRACLPPLHRSVSTIADLGLTASDLSAGTRSGSWGRRSSLWGAAKQLVGGLRGTDWLLEPSPVLSGGAV